MAISIITSKRAQKHLDEVKIKHAEIIKGMSEQSLRIQQINQQKAQEAQMKQQQDKVDAQAKQEADRQFNQKQSEINMKSYDKSK